MHEHISQYKMTSLRNAIYQGQFKNDRRHGQGVLLLDEGVILVGGWKNDVLFGSALAFLNSEQYAFLQFNRGELQGYCYFRSGCQMLVMQFNSGRAVDRQLLANFDEKKVKLTTYRNAAYELLENYELKQNIETVVVEKYLGIKMNCPTLIEYLQSNFCNNNERFQLKQLPNGFRIFKYNEKSSPISLGFVLGKADQLVSYGTYLNDKLHGFGCKYQNNAKYQGQFQNGFLNGLGLRFSNNKYSFGQFQNGNLTEALFLEERSSASEEKLKQLRKIDHIQSNHFVNGYIRRDLIKFKGISEVASMSSAVKEYLYSDFAPQRVNNSSQREPTISLNQLLSAKGKKAEDFEAKSILHSSQASRPRNPQDNNDFSQPFRVARTATNSPGFSPSMRKYY